MQSNRDFSSDDNRTKPERFLQNYGVIFAYVGIILLVILSLFPRFSVSISWEIVALVALLLVTPFIGNLKRIWVSNVGGVELDTEINETRASLDDLLLDISETPDAIELPQEGLEMEPSDLNIEEEQGDSDTKEEQGDSDTKEEQGDSDTEEERGSSNTEGEQDESQSDSRVDREKYGFSREKDQSEAYLDDLGGRPSEIADELYRLLEEHPRLALAKLRMEMEEAVDSLIISMGDEKPQTTSSRLNTLEKQGWISTEVLNTYSKIRNLCNKAIHGEEVQMQDAIEIVDIGVDFISGIRSRELYERFKRGEELDEDELDILNEHPITEQRNS
ncbi:DUF4145 domain-containing protein [Haloarchaeobius sp. TZWSO28]|uniref:DUF4145 domain-containing protein n=1 Tax=Haloarchaeobius sp. TZWSO28 TaxID=3446119 RepID=UPI003EBB7874